MNERFEFTNLIEPKVFDRLVDGELSATEERALVAALDAQPDGWRRCAAAFLEARAWRSDLGALASARRERINGTPTSLHALERCATGSASELIGGDCSASRGGSSTPPRRSHTLVIVASIAIAFFLGIAAQSQWASRGDAARDGIGGSPSGGGRPAGDIAVRDENSSNDDRGGTNTAARTLTMALVDGQGNVERQIEVPVVEADGFDPRWLQMPPSVMPEHVVKALRRSGHTVDEQRLFVPVWLDDGRQAIVALDRAEVKYTGMQF
ncbi:MAG: hypothetical protein WD894_02020 [Pirellulales bacterium]